METIFNINTAAKLARLSELAYSQDIERDPVSFSLALKNLGYELVLPLKEKITDTQGFVAKNSIHVVVVFRGTTGSVIDVATDTKVRLVDGKHEGFLTALTSVSDQLQLALSCVGSLPIIASGHSLGGALAKMAILQYPNLSWESCYTFGSPPICVDVPQLKPKVPIFRLINEGDVVPRSLDLNDAVYESIIKFLEFLSKNENMPEFVSEIYGYVKSVWPELKDYCHLGTERIYSRNGLLMNVNSIDIFNQVLKEDVMSVVDDHKIVNYINLLEKAVTNQIIKTEPEI